MEQQKGDKLFIKSLVMCTSNGKDNFLVFMSMGWEYTFEVRPLEGLLSISQMIYVYGEPWCYWQEKTEKS
jgi:hypothetical protein